MGCGLCRSFAWTARLIQHSVEWCKVDDVPLFLRQICTLCAMTIQHRWQMGTRRQLGFCVLGG